MRVRKVLIGCIGSYGYEYLTTERKQNILLKEMMYHNSFKPEFDYKYFISESIFTCRDYKKYIKKKMKVKGDN